MLTETDLVAVGVIKLVSRVIIIIDGSVNTWCRRHNHVADVDQAARVVADLTSLHLYAQNKTQRHDRPNNAS